MEGHCCIGLIGKVKEHIRTLQNNTRNTLPQSMINALLFFMATEAVRLSKTMSMKEPKQHEFLANDKNKSQFIDLLRQCLSRDGHNVKQSENDADTLIVKSALDSAHSGHVTTVVADDTDLLVLLLHHFQSTAMADIFLLSEASKRQRQVIKFINVRRLVNLLGKTLVSHLLFIHASSGCNRTSAI